MGTQETNAKRGAQKEVYAILADKVIKKLKDGIVPWRVPWTKAGLPENLVSGNQYRGINRMLLASLGYERNLFLTANQLQAMNGAVLANERPHTIAFLSDSTRGAEVIDTSPESEKIKRKLSYYTVYNIAQCMWPEGKTFPEVVPELDPISVVIPTKAKDTKFAYYDPCFDVINLPAEKHFESKEHHTVAHFHQLMHATGHHSRLNRRDLVQMSEFGYDAFSHEELVAEIGTSYLMSHHGIAMEFVPTEEYLVGWIRKFETDRYLLFSAANAAEKAISFLFIGETEPVAQ